MPNAHAFAVVFLLAVPPGPAAQSVPPGAAAQPVPPGPAAEPAPAGWTRADASGVVVFVAPGGPANVPCVVLLPRPEALTQPDPAPWFMRAWQALKSRYRDIQESAATTSRRGDRTISIVAGSMRDARGAFVYVSFAAVSNGTMVQPAVFVAGTSQLYSQHGQAFSGLLANLDILPGAPAAVGLAGGGWTAVLGMQPAAAGSQARGTQAPGTVNAASGPQASAAPSSAGGPVVAGLIGNWGDTAVPVIAFYDPATRRWGDPPGNVEAWTFRADGTYAHARSVQTLQGYCRMTLDAWDEGSWSGDAGVITTAGRSAFVKSINTCVPGATANYERAGRIETLRSSYRLENGGRVLVLQRPGFELRLQRQ